MCVFAFKFLYTLCILLDFCTSCVCSLFDLCTSCVCVHFKCIHIMCVCVFILNLYTSCVCVFAFKFMDSHVCLFAFRFIHVMCVCSLKSIHIMCVCVRFSIYARHLCVCSLSNLYTSCVCMCSLFDHKEVFPAVKVTNLINSKILMEHPMGRLTALMDNTLSQIHVCPTGCSICYNTQGVPALTSYKPINTKQEYCFTIVRRNVCSLVQLPITATYKTVQHL